MFALLGYGAFAGLLLHFQLINMRGLPDLGDPLFSIWRLGWISQQLTGDPRPLFDANIFHPERGTLTFSDSMLLPGLAAAPLRAFGLHPAVIYNVLLIGSFVLTACATFLLVRDLTGSVAAAFVSGLIFGFYPYRFEHYSHLELQMTMWMPCTLLALHRFLNSGRPRWAYGVALFGAAQFYSSMYYGVFLAVFSAVVSLTWAFSSPVRLSVRRFLGPIAGASLLALVLVAPLAAVYSRSGPVSRGRPAAEVRHYSATPVDYMRTHRRSAVWADLMPTGQREERQLFPGLTILLLGVLGIAISRDRSRWAFVAGGAIAFDASLGANGFSYPLLIEWVPGFRSMRVPARFGILVGLSLAVLAGYAFARTSSSRVRIAALIAATIGIAVDVWPAIALREIWLRPPSIYAALPASGAVLAEFPAGGRPERFRATPYLYFSNWHWNPIINGYSGYFPQSYIDAVEILGRFPASETLELLRARGVTHVTVNCALFALAGQEGRCDRTLAAARRRQDLREVFSATWEGRPVVLFELRARDASEGSVGTRRR